MEFVLKENVDTCSVVALCPGLTEKDITIQADSKNNKLSISGKSAKENEDIETAIEGTVTVAEKYDVATAKKTIKDGILTIEMEVAKHIKSI